MSAQAADPVSAVCIWNVPMARVSRLTLRQK